MSQLTSTRTRSLRRVSLLTLIAVTGTVGAAWAATGTPPSRPRHVKVTPEHTRSCVGDSAILTWSPPATTYRKRLRGYEIETQLDWLNPPIGPSYSVGPDVTSLPVRLYFGPNTFLVRARTHAGLSEPNYDTAFAGAAPQAQSFGSGFGSAVGDGTVTIRLGWFGPIVPYVTGGLPDTITLTRSPDRAQFKYPAPNEQTLYTFSGLTNGTTYSFTAVTANHCGKSLAAKSPKLTPGVGPSWTHADPPLGALAAETYRYQFQATGDPLPGYALSADAPEWLRINHTTGDLAGVPPDGTSSFTYSVIADNHVGVRSIAPTAITAGPFTVTVDG
jgi:hypothetical protein